jgi:hypothetical protein
MIFIFFKKNGRIIFECQNADLVNFWREWVPSPKVSEVPPVLAPPPPKKGGLLPECWDTIFHSTKKPPMYCHLDVGWQGMQLRSPRIAPRPKSE